MSTTVTKVNSEHPLGVDTACLWVMPQSAAYIVYRIDAPITHPRNDEISIKLSTAQLRSNGFPHHISQSLSLRKLR
jgi:hypothetical protein